MAIDDEVVLVKALPEKSKLRKTDMFLVDDSVNDTYTVTWESIVEALMEKLRKKRIGTMVIGFNANPPSGTLLCDGKLVDKARFSDLYVVIGDMFKQNSDSDEAKFRLPDMRKLFVRGADDGSNTLGKRQEDGIREIRMATSGSDTISASLLVSKSDYGSIVNAHNSGAFKVENTTDLYNRMPVLRGTGERERGTTVTFNFRKHSISLNNSNRVADEVRPVNISANYFIYY